MVDIAEVRCISSGQLAYGITMVCIAVYERSVGVGTVGNAPIALVEFDVGCQG